MFLNQITDVSKRSLPNRQAPESRTNFEFSGGGERELGMDVRFRSGLAVRASGTAGRGAGAERLVDDGLDGARTTAAFGAAAEASVDLLGIARKGIRAADSAADIVVAEDVAGTDNHKRGGPSVMRGPSIFKTAAGCKRKNRLFK
jgi:hypothetical protein